LRLTFFNPLVRAYDRFAARTASRLLSGPRFMTALALYLLLIALIKGQLYLGGLGHDADQLVLSQAFQLGYDNRNPPLFTWLVIGASQFLGPGLGAVLAVKSLTMLTLYGFLYLAARRALHDPVMAALAALAPFAMYEVGLWLAIKYSNTAALAALCTVSVYVLLRLGESGRTFWYAAFGVVAGLGLLAKYNFAIILVALILASLCDAGFRARLRDRRILLSLAIALAIVAPHAYWMVTEAPGYQESTSGRFGMGSGLPWRERLTLGTLAGIKAILNMLLPLALGVPFLAWTAWRRRETANSVEANTAENWPGRRYFRLFGIYLLICIAAVFVLVAVSGAVKVRGHYLFIFLPFPIWMFAWLQGLRPSRIALNRIALAFVLLALASPAIMAVKYLSHPLGDREAPYNLPYAALAERLREAGFTRGTLYAHDYPYSLSGNLRPYLPGVRILGSNTPHFTPPANDAPGDCLLLWATHRKSASDGSMIEKAAELFDFEAGTQGEAEPGAQAGAVEKSLLSGTEVEIAGGRGRKQGFAYRLFPDGAGTCR
jgi:4-amino-4-deoxy-L-arabinose transferase-like glycosyltransferase